MAKKEEILKTVIIFLFFLFGCSHKYVDVRGRSLDEKIVASWEELDCRVVGQNKQGFSLGLEVKNVIVVGDYVKAGELYKNKSVLHWALLGAVIGLGGCFGGVSYGLSNFPEYDEGQYERSMLICFGSCFAGLGVVVLGGANRREVVKGIPDLIRGDTVCVDSELLSMQYVNILIAELNFEKEYYTDRNGNLELKFDDIIPEPTEADSIINLIIRYYELVDTVKVRRL